MGLARLTADTAGGGLADFIEGLGPGQLVGRQVLAAPALGDVQLALCDRKGRLEVEVIRARGLQARTGSKLLPGKILCKTFINHFGNSLLLFPFKPLMSKCTLSVVNAAWPKPKRPRLEGRSTRSINNSSPSVFNTQDAFYRYTIFGFSIFK